MPIRLKWQYLLAPKVGVPTLIYNFNTISCPANYKIPPNKSSYSCSRYETGTSLQLRPTPGGVFANGINLFLMMSGLASFASCVESNTDNTLMIYLPVITNILFSFKNICYCFPQKHQRRFSVLQFFLPHLLRLTQVVSIIKLCTSRTKGTVVNTLQ